MQELTIENINTIEEEVSRSGITFSHLREELIDHICCQVEREMIQGSSFEEALNKTHSAIGNKGLKKIQENTLLLIDKKYRIMKKTMKISGLISMSLMTLGAIFKIQHFLGAGAILALSFVLMAFVFLPAALYVMKKEITMKGGIIIFIIALIGGIPLLLGVLFKIQHWPGANILLLLGYLVISLVFIPSLLISKLKEGKTQKLKTAYILGAVSISLYLLGDLFKIMHYPGAGPLLFVAAVLLTTVFLPVYGYQAFKDSSYVKGGFIYLCVGIFFFNLFNILLALNVSKDVLSFYEKPGEEILMTTKLIEKKNNAIITHYTNDSIYKDTAIFRRFMQTKKMADELVKYIENIKIDLIKAVDGVSEKEAILCSQNPKLIMNKSDFNKPTNFLCGNDENRNTGKARELKQKIEFLKKSFLTYCDSNKIATTLVDKALETTIPLSTDEPNLTWELYHFYHLPVIAVVNKLSSFRRNVRFAEQEVLQSLINDKEIKSTKTGQSSKIN